MAGGLEVIDWPGLDHMTAVGMETVSSPQTIWTKKRLMREVCLSEAYLVAIAIRKEELG